MAAVKELAENTERAIEATKRLHEKTTHALAALAQIVENTDTSTPFSASKISELEQRLALLSSENTALKSTTDQLKESTKTLQTVMPSPTMMFSSPKDKDGQTNTPSNDD